jgi:hypothetical protein
MLLATAVEIVAAPIGEAPLWVREAWIGLELPLAWPSDAQRITVYGVLTMPTSRFGLLWANLLGRRQRVDGYRVTSAEAIHLLGKHRADAAAWWRAEAPAFLEPGMCFVFDAPACRPVYAG